MSSFTLNGIPITLCELIIDHSRRGSLTAALTVNGHPTKYYEYIIHNQIALGPSSAWQRGSNSSLIALLSSLGIDEQQAQRAFASVLSEYLDDFVEEAEARYKLTMLGFSLDGRDENAAHMWHVSVWNDDETELLEFGYFTTLKSALEQVDSQVREQESKR